MENQTIRFNKNWNNKLNCQSFSTIRLSNPKKYKPDEIYNILLTDSKGRATKNFGFAKLLSINEFLLDNITPAMSYIDTNYNVPEFIKLFKTMYKNYQIDFSKKKLVFLTLQFTDKIENRKTK